MLTGVTFCYWTFFHIVKSLITILPTLLISAILWTFWLFLTLQFINEVTVICTENLWFGGTGNACCKVNYDIMIRHRFPLHGYPSLSLLYCYDAKHQNKCDKPRQVSEPAAQGHLIPSEVELKRLLNLVLVFLTFLTRHVCQKLLSISESLRAKLVWTVCYEIVHK